jgi:two-component system response regulator NreC
VSLVERLRATRHLIGQHMTDDLNATDTQIIRIVLADGHAVVRGALRGLLNGERDFQVVAEAADIEATRRCVRGHHPDVLVLDLNTAGALSLDAISLIRREAPDTQIVLLTMQDEPAFAHAASGAGAIGCVAKAAAEDELVQTVRRAAAGERSPTPLLGASSATEPPAVALDDLTEREVDVLRLIALGHTNAEIAEKLYLSVRTVETHRAHIQHKLRLTSRAQLVRYALERGLMGA